MICEVEFEDGEREFSFYPYELELKPGDFVIFKAKRGKEIGRIAKLLDSGESSTQIIQKATPDDIEEYKRIKVDELRIYNLCEEKAKELEIPIKVVTVHIQFDRSLIRVDFLSEKKIDLKSFMKEIAKVCKSRIELRQIGARDYAKRFNAYGICGRPVCCSAFLTEFESITLDFIRLQHLSCGTSKLTGVCGRLMCCLAYERKLYEEIEKEDK
ncbi:MAG: regulatory iron-sulfur-containing complex subunit RicT [bacterium]|nr:regulatory iron-sulfur-containing complex subunit RicT [bacterium]